jgi:hydroxyethylthiazole kinase-like uncharacterized protein yjeF
MRFISKKDINLPIRKKESRKGENGKVLVIGGSKDYVGAVALAGLAALRSGADWVTIAAPEKVGWAINALSPDLVVKKYKGDDFCASRAKDILDFEKSFDSVLIGNGMGMHAGYFVKKYVNETKKLLVIDADGIKSVDTSIVKNSIITPHIKELETFMKNSKINSETIKKIVNEKNIGKKALLIKNSFRNFLNKNNVILLKGPVDIIISESRVLFSRGGNAGMTKAGTGDVLAGLCVGFLAQSKNLLQSAVNSSYFNKQIGDILMKKKKGFTYLASDMAEEIERIVKKKVTK